MQYHFEQLKSFEFNSQIWDVKYKNIPLWFYIRGRVQKDTPSTTVITLNFKRFFLSFFSTIKFLIKKKNYTHMFFVSGRKRLVDICEAELGKGDEACFFIKYESITETWSNKRNEYDAYFLEFIRYLFRKFAFYFCYQNYKSKVCMLNEISLKGGVYINSGIISKGVSDAIGDSFYYRFLDIFIIKNNPMVGYSCCVIPMAEKFLNHFNSFELQHGVIHSKHPGYAFVPYIKNSLLLYDKTYARILEDIKYSGPYRYSGLDVYNIEEESNNKYQFVIFTGVCEVFSKIISSFVENYPSDLIKIKKHPRDTYKYSLDSSYFIDSYNAADIIYPIVLKSTVIDDFTALGKTVFLFNYLKLTGQELEELIIDVNEVYNRNGNLKCEFFSDFSELIEGLNEF